MLSNIMKEDQVLNLAFCMRCDFERLIPTFGSALLPIKCRRRKRTQQDVVYGLCS